MGKAAAKPGAEPTPAPKPTAEDLAMVLGALIAGDGLDHACLCNEDHTGCAEKVTAYYNERRAASEVVE